jgi:hypothetical protein
MTSCVSYRKSAGHIKIKLVYVRNMRTRGWREVLSLGLCSDETDGRLLDGIVMDMSLG